MIMRQIATVRANLTPKKGRLPMKTTSHPNLAPSKILGTVAKLIRLTEKEEVEWSHWQHPTNNVTARRNLADYLQRGCPRINDKGEINANHIPESHELARHILGKDYITPKEIESAYYTSYSDEQLENLTNTLPDAQTIFWLRINGFMLIPGPTKEMNLIDIRNRDKKLYYSYASYANCSIFDSNSPIQKYSQEDTIRSGEWLAIRKEEVPNSFDLTWKEQRKLLTKDERIPNAAEVSYAVISFYRIRREHLLFGKYVRTSSVSDNYPQIIIVGGFDEGGLVVTQYHHDRCRSYLGISSALT
jgi:hypothetical protein